MNLFKKTSILGFIPICFLSAHLQRVSFPSPVSVAAPPLLPPSPSPTPFHPLHLPSSPPPPAIFLCVYLSTFTVTALESQESELAPSPLPRRRSVLPSPSPSFSVTTVEIHIALCIRGMEGPPYSPSRQPALSCSSHAQSPPPCQASHT